MPGMNITCLVASNNGIKSQHGPSLGRCMNRHYCDSRSVCLCEFVLSLNSELCRIVAATY